MLVHAAIVHHIVKGFVIANAAHFGSIMRVFSLYGPTFRWLPWM